MPTLKINGQDVTVPAGTSILEAAKLIGEGIPHYCYHPGLSTAGNCRMCLVDVEKIPKLQISCNTQVAEGMVVHTQSEKVKEAQQAVLEFLLVNHPLDCPVCDQSGECELQNYYMKYGLYDSRLVENKVKKHKAVPIGPTVMLDAERCVLCSRCVRFCNEVTGTNELGIVNRGNHAEIVVAPGKELDNKYSGNVVDICPVGALTDRDFRFKCRVWFLEGAPSVCPGCSQGCNIEIHWNKVRPYQTPDERVMRLKPRFNEAVNKWWICDEGRYDYHWIDQNRIAKPLKRVNGALIESSWKDALKEMGSALARPEDVAVIISTSLTNEDLWMAREVFEKMLRVQNIAYLSTKKTGLEDKLLIKADKSPNTRGAQALGFKDGALDLLSKCFEGKIRTLVLFGHSLIELIGKEKAEQIAKNVEHVIWMGSNQDKDLTFAEWILPSAVYAEKDGTFTNFQGRVQRIFKVLEPLGEAKPEWVIMQELAQHLGLVVNFADAEAVFNGISEKVENFQGMSYDVLGKKGMVLRQL